MFNFIISNRNYIKYNFYLKIIKVLLLFLVTQIKIMDNFDHLPNINNTEQTPEERKILNQYFPGTNTGVDNRPQPNNVQQQPNIEKYNLTSFSSKNINWKLLGMTVVLFAVLCNPIVNNLICQIPNCDNTLISTGLKTLIFTLLLISLNFFF